MPSYSVADAYLAHSAGVRVGEVRALLTLAPRSATEAWSGAELRQWIACVDQITDVEIECALTLATAWGAGENHLVATAAHVALVRCAPEGPAEEAKRLRRHIDSVCSHLRSGLPGHLARRLPRTQAALPELSSAVIWAYFFACLSVLLFSIAITR